jgi:dolichol-phosphate mannosyltransferase
MSFLRCDAARQSSPMQGLMHPFLQDLASSVGAHSGDEPRSRASDGSFLSVVIPARNEAPSLAQLIDETTSSVRALCQCRPRGLEGFEIILVDDASTDETRSVLNDLIAFYPELRAITLTSGVGQSGALLAGIQAALGNWIATLDADLQNNPADLVRLWNALPGYDVALGWRRTRRDCWRKRVASRLANWVRNAVLGQSIRDTGCSVRIFPRAVALRLPVFRGVHRFLGPLFLREGCRLVQVPVEHRWRPYGFSHYNVWNRSLDVIADLIGVAWLMRRPVRGQVVQSRAIGEPLSVAEPSVTTLRTSSHRAWER